MYRSKSILIIAIFFSLAQTIMAQDELFTVFDQRKDKAVSELTKFTNPDTARVNALIKVFTTAVFLKQQQQVKIYCDEALIISRRLNYTKGLAACYLFTGNFNRSSGNTTNAFTYFDSLIQVTRDAKDSTILERRAQAYRWKGMMNFTQENYYEALNNFFEALKYYDYDIGRVTFFVYNDIADIYMRLNNIDQAIFYAKKNAALAEKGFSKAYQAEAYLTLVDIYIKKNDLQLATNYLDRVKTYIPDSIEMVINFGYYENRGRISYLQAKYDSAYSYYQQAYRYAEVNSHSQSINTALYFLSTISLKLGKMDDAKKYAEANLALAEKTNGKLSKIDALLSLSEYYHKTGNQSKAFTLLQQATDLKDSLLSETNIKQVNSLAAIYQTDKKQKEIIQLQNEKKIQSVAVEQKSMLNNIFITTIIGLLVFGYLAYKNAKNEQEIANQKQEIQMQKISELKKDTQLITADAMLKGQEEERSRIAKDLHDGLGGMLSGIKFSFINMKDNMILSAENVNGFERSIQMLDTTISELRKVAHNLMPEALVRFGLDEALRDYCNSIQTSSGIKIIYQQFGEDRKLSTRAEITVYRIIQELINNALKYAEAKQIIVQLTKNHIKTGITVEDNGKGFDVNILDLKKGAGFTNIKYRVNYYKGTLDINSEPGNGTSVNIELMT